MRASVQLVICALVGLAASPIALAAPVRSLSTGTLYGRDPQSVGIAPGVQNVGSPGVQNVGSPGEQNVGSPGEQNVGSPGQQNVGSPGEQNVGSPGEQNVGSPGEQNVGSPGQQNVGSPGEQNIGVARDVQDTGIAGRQDTPILPDATLLLPLGDRDSVSDTLDAPANVRLSFITPQPDNIIFNTGGP